MLKTFTMMSIFAYMQHLSSLFPPLTDVLRLGEERLDLILLVEGRDQLRLEIVLDKVDEEMHDGLRNAVLNRLPDNVEVRLD